MLILGEHSQDTRFGLTVGIALEVFGKRWLKEETSISLPTITLGLVSIPPARFVMSIGYHLEGGCFHEK